MLWLFRRLAKKSTSKIGRRRRERHVKPSKRRGKMGNEESRPVAEGPPETLKARSIEALAEYIKSGSVKSIVFMVGLFLYVYIYKDAFLYH